MGERTKQLQDAVFLSKVRKARKQSIGEKLLEGPRLFDVACQRMRVGIRHQFPDDDDDQCCRSYCRCADPADGAACPSRSY